MKRTKHHIGSTKAKRRAALQDGCLATDELSARAERRALPVSAGGGAFLQSASPSGTSLAPVPAVVLADTSPRPSPHAAHAERESGGGLRRVCMDCGAELPGSNPRGTRVSHGLCVVDFQRRMAEVRAA